MILSLPRRRAVLGLFVCLLLTADIGAGEPALRSLNFRGLEIGGTTNLVIDGDELGAAPRLLLPFPAKQALVGKTTAKQATFEVTLAGDVVPGYYHLRVATDQGVSLPAIIGVDRLPQRPLSASVDLPVALHGTIAGSAVAETKFTGKKGQKVQIDVEAQRLGSKLRPVVHLISPRGLQVAWAWPSVARTGDTRLLATLSEDGPHTVTLHDSEYAGAAPGFYRLKLGQWSYVDHVFPAAVTRGKKATVELLGATAEKTTAAAMTKSEFLALAWPKDGVWSGPRPFVRVSNHSEIVEEASAGTEKGQTLATIPTGISGRHIKPHEEDRYRIPVSPGMKLRLEVFAERYGSPQDTALVVRNEAGAVLSRAEDSPGTLDPVLDFTVPDKTTAIIIGVVDAQGRGGSQAVYRLVIEPAAGAISDFRLVTPASRLALPDGGFEILQILAERRGYQGGITLSAEGLPTGVRLEGNNIPPEADGALVTLRRDGKMGDSGISRWIGKAATGDEETVVIKGHPLDRIQPWLASEIAVAATTRKADDYRVTWRDLPSDAALVPSKKLALPVKVTRPDEKASIKLTLVTSQVVKLVNNQPDPNGTLRLEKAVEFGPKVTEGELSLLVPAALPGPVYDVSVQAEWLAADKKTVVASSFTPVRRLEVRPPVVVKLDGPLSREVILESKKETAIKLQGQVERRDGLASDVALTLTGLPAGARADAVTVKAGTTAFTLNVFLPANAMPGEIKALKLGATAPADPKTPNVRVKARDVDLTLVVKVAAK